MSVYNATRRRPAMGYANNFNQNPFDANVYFGDANNGWNQLGAMLGAVLGNNTRLHAEDRQRKKLDDYINQVEQEPLTQNVNALQTSSYASLNGATPTLNGMSSIDKILDNMDNRQMLSGVNYTKQQSDMTPIEKAKQRYNNLNTDKLTAWARSNGVSENVLNERLPSLQKELSANVGALMLPEITKNLYSGNVDNILTGMQQLDELKQYDPAAYERYSKVADQQLARRQAFNDNVALARMKGGNKPIYQISDNVFNTALKANQELVGLGVPLTSEQQAVYNSNAQIIAVGSAERGLGGQMIGGAVKENKQPETTITQEQKEQETKFLEDINSGMMNAIIASGQDYERFKIAAAKPIEVMRNNGMSDEAIEKTMKAYFDSTMKTLHPEQFKNPDRGARFVESIVTGKPLVQIAHR